MALLYQVDDPTIDMAAKRESCDRLGDMFTGLNLPRLALKYYLKDVRQNCCSSNNADMYTHPRVYIGTMSCCVSCSTDTYVCIIVHNMYMYVRIYIFMCMCACCLACDHTYIHIYLKEGSLYVPTCTVLSVIASVWICPIA